MGPTFLYFFAELEESSEDDRSTTRQHKQAYDEIKRFMDAETAKSSKETQEAENMAIRYLGLRFCLSLHPLIFSIVVVASV